MSATSSTLPPLVEASRSLVAATDRLSLLADTASEEEFEAATAEWFRHLADYGRTLQIITGLSAAELAERLVP